MNDEKIQYLRIMGRLYPNNRLEIRRSYLTDSPRIRKEAIDSPLIAHLINEKGRLLLKYHLSTKRYYADGNDVNDKAVRGYIPFPLETHLIRFFNDDVLIHEMMVSKEKPNLEITWKPPKTVEGVHMISWEASHPENKKLQFFLRYTFNDGKTWQRASLTTDELKSEINFDELPGNIDCRVAVVATDGINTVIKESDTFSNSVKPCKAMILEPDHGSVFQLQETVVFRGQGFYLEENKADTEHLIWESSIDSKLGQGMLLEVSDLSTGSHIVTLRAGKEDRVGKSTIEIKIQGKKQNKY